MDIRDAIEILMDIQSDWEDGEEYETFNLAIKALEKQAFFENEVEEIRDWFVNNKDCLLDSAMIIARNGFLESNKDEYIDDIDLEFIVSDIVDEIQKGILNVLSTYIDD